MKATITQTTDAGMFELARDEYGGLWRYAGDDMQGNVMVEEVAGGERQETLGRAGVFVYDPRIEDEGVIYPRRDGDTFGVNCADEFVVKGGEWVSAVDA